jgi:hypothetical protein
MEHSMPCEDLGYTCGKYLPVIGSVPAKDEMPTVATMHSHKVSRLLGMLDAAEQHVKILNDEVNRLVGERDEALKILEAGASPCSHVQHRPDCFSCHSRRRADAEAENARLKAQVAEAMKIAERACRNGYLHLDDWQNVRTALRGEGREGER